MTAILFSLDDCFWIFIKRRQMCYWTCFPQIEYHSRHCFEICVPIIENWEKNVFGCFIFFSCFFSFFSKKNQVPQIIIGLGWVIYQKKALTFVIWTFVIQNECSWCQAKAVWNFWFFILFRAIKASEQSYFNCLKDYNVFNLKRKSLILFEYRLFTLSILLHFWNQTFQKTAKPEKNW